MTNLREMYYELRCLDCGNDNGNSFFVWRSAYERVIVSGKGDFCEAIEFQTRRFYWDTLKCVACGSTNVQRKRRYRQVQR